MTYGLMHMITVLVVSHLVAAGIGGGVGYWLRKRNVA